MQAHLHDIRFVGHARAAVDQQLTDGKVGDQHCMAKTNVSGNPVRKGEHRCLSLDNQILCERSNCLLLGYDNANSMAVRKGLDGRELHELPRKL